MQESALLDAIARHVARAERPLPLRTLGTALRGAGLEVTTKELPAHLDRLVREGRAFEHPIARHGSNPSRCFWSRPATEYVEGALGRTLAAGGEWSEAQLRRSVPKAYHAMLDEAVGRLLSEGRLFEAPPKGKSRRLRTTPARARDALGAAQMKSLRSVVQRVNTLRRPALGLDELLAFFDGPEPGAAPRAPGTTLAPTEELLRRFYAADLPRRAGLRSMPIPWTWHRYLEHCRERAASPDAERFHSLLLELAHAGRVALTAHDKPASLPPEELEHVRRRPDGSVVYYWMPLP